MNFIIDLIKKLFGKKPQCDDNSAKTQSFKEDYEDVSNINFTAIFANKISNMVVAESSVDVSFKDVLTKRSEFIKRAIENVWDCTKKITSQVLGKGGKVIVPYIDGNKACFSIIDQTRIFVDKTQGEKIVSATLLSDQATIGSKKYFRFSKYSLEGTTHKIINCVTDEYGTEYPLLIVSEWANISEQIIVENVDRLLFSFMKNVTDNRGDKEIYGVPITFGAESEMEEAKVHLKEIAKEYKLKSVMLGLDSRMWDNPETKKTVQDNNRPFVKVYNEENEKTLWLEYSPEIRDSAMYARLQEIYQRMEKAVGTSAGILTERKSNNATATEIKASQYDTFCIVSDVRKVWEKVIGDLAYSFDVLAEAYELTPTGARGQYKVTFDWDMSLYENSAETFAEMSELESKQLVSGAELRQYVKGGKIEDCESAIDEISKSKRFRLG